MTTILLTGATGFIGGATAAELLSAHPECRLLFLVRAGSRAEAWERLRRSVARFHSGTLGPAFDRCGVLVGDLTEAGFLHDPRLDEVTHVLHAAACTSFRSVRTVRHVNILGTLTLAHRMRRVSRLRRFLHAGTAHICGTAAPSVVMEDDFPSLSVRHAVEYTASKAEAELLLERTAPELPLVVARPSVVVGHTRLGCGPSASLFWYYRALAELHRIPFSADARRDVVPVDYVAEALVKLLLAVDLRHRRYHISAGTGSAVPWRQIAAVFATCAGRSIEPDVTVDFPTLVRERQRLRERLGPGDEDRFLTAMEVYFRLSRSGAEVFDNGRLLAEGLPPPPRFTDYLPTCVRSATGRSVYEQMADDD
jgi:nucleoside-diphosphate-sugar epimerase